MGLFHKNNGGSAPATGERPLTEVIKNGAQGELLIWRHPEEDFNTNATLVVMPGEKAIFVKSGTIEQVFENGTYKLSTENYPFLSRLRKFFTGGVSSFNCVIYFVRTAHSMEIRWGTDSPIQVRDKLLGIATKLRCRGIYKVSIENPGKFLEKLVGNNVLFETQEGLGKYFIGEFQSKIKSVIARAVNESTTELLGIDARLDEFSEMIQPFMQETVDAYGLRCVKFVVSAIDIDDDELRRRYDEIGMNSIETIRKAQGDKAAMDILGDNWIKQQNVEIMRDLVNNPNAGNMGTMGAGVGMGFAAGNAFGNMAYQTFAPSTPPASAQAAQTEEDPFEKLAKLKKMLDAGLIERSEYDAKKAEILSRM